MGMRTFLGALAVPIILGAFSVLVGLALNGSEVALVILGLVFYFGLKMPART